MAFDFYSFPKFHDYKNVCGEMSKHLKIKAFTNNPLESLEEN